MYFSLFYIYEILAEWESFTPATPPASNAHLPWKGSLSRLPDPFKMSWPLRHSTGTLSVKKKRHQRVSKEAADGVEPEPLSIDRARSWETQKPAPYVYRTGSCLLQGCQRCSPWKDIVRGCVERRVTLQLQQPFLFRSEYCWEAIPFLQLPVHDGPSRQTLRP